MKLTITVDLDSTEQIAGQPASAAVTVRPERGAADLLAVAHLEAASPYLPAEWGDCAAAIVGARLLAAGLRVGVPAVMAGASVRCEPVRVRLSGVGDR